jgi:hypothetical protein
MLPDKEHTLKLPKEFQKYFWDVSFDELSFDKYPRFIAERLLNYGNLNGIRWLLSHTDTRFIRTLVDTSRNLNAKTKNYWQIILTDY